MYILQCKPYSPTHYCLEFYIILTVSTFSFERPISLTYIYIYIYLKYWSFFRDYTLWEETDPPRNGLLYMGDKKQSRFQPWLVGMILTLCSRRQTFPLQISLATCDDKVCFLPLNNEGSQFLYDHHGSKTDASYSLC